MDWSIIMAFGTAIASGSAAWGATKATLNGTRTRVKKIDETLDQHVKDDLAVQASNIAELNSMKTETVQRLTKIETILEERLPIGGQR